MKKKLLFIPLISLIALPSCGNKTSRNKKGDVVSNAVLKANTKAIKKNIFSDFSLEEEFTSLVGEESLTVSNGFVIRNNGEQISFFSTLLNEEVASISTSDTYKTYPSTVSGGFVSYVTSEGVSVIDGLGNKLIENSKRTYTTLTITSGINQKDIYYCDVKFDDTSYYYHYSEDGKATVHSTNMGDDYGSGSTVQGLDYVLLDDFGHPGYQRIKNSSRYIIFDNKGNEISSFTDPKADSSFFVGDYLIYQNSVKLDQNNNNYDYINELGERYSLETYRINYLNAKKEAITVNYLLGTTADDIHSFKNARGIYTYAYANLKIISDKKILSPTKETYIIDATGALHDNVTGINLGAFERLGDNYYNTDSKTIYDGNLNELSILTNMNPVKVDNADMIVCVVEGKYGAVNQRGKVVLPFEYDYIYTTYMTSNRALVVDDGITKVVSFDSKKPSHKDVLTIEEGTIDYFGCGIYHINDQYFSLNSNEPDSLIHKEGNLVSVYYAVSNVTNKAVLFTLEDSESAFTYYSSLLNITR